MTGRNDPCPCGSGKKYKRCHYQLDAAHSRARTANHVALRSTARGELEAIVAAGLIELRASITQHSLNNQIASKGWSQLVASFFGALAHGEAQAVVALVKAELEQQALVNYRVLVECWTKATFYAEYPPEAEKFLASFRVERGRLAFLRGHRLPKQLRAKVEGAAAEALANRPSLESWEEPGVEQMMTTLAETMPPKDRQLAYFMNYRYASSFVHGGIILLPTVLTSNAQGDKVDDLSHTRLSFSNHVLRNVARIILSLAFVVSQLHGVDLTSKFQSLDARIDQLGDLGEGPPSDFQPPSESEPATSSDTPA